MTHQLDPSDIYQRGLDDLDSLEGPERLVFMLQDFDNMMEMEGWDHSFMNENHFRWYPEMKDWLKTIGDEASLAVLEDYESHLQARGVRLDPDEIQDFLDSQDDADLDSRPDWCEQYCGLREERWAKAIDYLKSRGLRLADVGPDTAPDPGPTRRPAG